MNIDDGFKPRNATLLNLAELSKRQSDIFDLRICEISELADNCVALSSELLENGMNIYEMLSFLSESIILALDSKYNDESATNDTHVLNSFFRFSSFIDKATFCDLFLKKLKIIDKEIKETDFLSSRSKPDTFIFVKNPLSDEAYDVFSQFFDTPRLKYAKNFKDAVKSVSNGEVSYCLLPLEERGGVRLPGVAELIFQSDLKIDFVTPVFGLDGSADIKYALLSKDFIVPPIDKDDDRYLEIRLKIGGKMSLSELLAVADFYGILPYRVNTISFYTEEGQSPHYSIVLRDEGRDFSPLLTYLTLFSSTFIPIGIYRNLD